MTALKNANKNSHFNNCFEYRLEIIELTNEIVVLFLPIPTFFFNGCLKKIYDRRLMISEPWLRFGTKLTAWEHEVATF